MRAFPAIIATALALLPVRTTCAAQAQPESIPLAVAQAVSGFLSPMFGAPTFVAGRTPSGWPDALLPRGASVLGGGVVGDGMPLRVETAVFVLAPGDDVEAVGRELGRKGGYVPHAQADVISGGQGFQSSAPEGKLPVLCRGTESILSTAIVDSAVSRRVIMVTVLSGEVALQDCGNTNARDLARADMFGHSPTVVPALIAPRGVAAQNSGSHWSGSSGEVQSLLRTTMPVDSIIRHYTTQLLAAGWKTDGSLLADASAGLQRFTFREADEPWTAMLIIMAVGDRREVGLRVSRVNAAY